MDKFEFLFETWLDKIACIGLGVIIASIGFMLYSHEPEATASGIATHPSVSESIARQIHQRTPAIQTALDKADALWASKDYTQMIAVTQEIIKQDPKEPFAYMYLARAQLASGNLVQSLLNYGTAVKMNPDFVDKKSPDKIGPELKALVRSAEIETRKKEFKQQPDAKKGIKALYYLQRRLAGGCE